MKWKAITGIGIAILILAAFLGYEITTDTYYCQAEPEKLLECSWGISGGLGTRCYLNPLLNRWDYCKTGWIKAIGEIEQDTSVVQQYQKLVKEQRRITTKNCEVRIFNCSKGLKINGSMVDCVSFQDGLIYPFPREFDNMKDIMNYTNCEFLKSVETVDTYVDIPKFNITIGQEVKVIDFSSFGNCKINGTCIICDSYSDGNGDGNCHSGESCIKHCYTNGVITTLEKNSRKDFVVSDRSFPRKLKKLIPKETTLAMVEI